MPDPPQNPADADVRLGLSVMLAIIALVVIVSLLS